MKPVAWLGDSRKAVSRFPDDAQHQVGYQLFRVQEGRDTADWKPMAGIGAGVREIRIHAGNEHRVLSVAKFGEAVYVLHAFMKKTQRPAKVDLDLAAERYRALVSERVKG